MIYIYPYGTSGKQLEKLIEYVDNKKVKHIDDSIDKISLKELKEEILQNNGIVYIALSTLPNDYQKRRKILIEKCQKYNIPYMEGKILEYAKKAIEKLKLECKKKGWDRIFALICPDFAKDKHLGTLGLELEKRGEKVLYFCSQEGSYKRALKNYNPNKNCILYLSYEYLFLLEFPTAICVTSAYNYPKNPKVIFIGHGLTNYKWYDDAFMLNNFKDNYICVAGDEFTPKESLGFKIIKSGYLGYDKDVRKLDEVNFSKDCVLFAPYDLKELKEVKPLMQEVAQKYKVILRHRYEWEESHLEILGDFANTIEIDKSKPMACEIYGRSFTLVCSKTTTKSSFPLMALSPSIVLKNNALNFQDVHESLGISVDSSYIVAGGGGIYDSN